MMGTRAAAFAGKISNLRDSILRIQNGTTPQPTCIDLANMLKYFCQVFNDFRDFKDIEHIPLFANEKRDQLIRALPNFDYSGLYKTLAQLVDILPLIPQPSTGYEQLSNNLLLLFECIAPFLNQANMETMPYLVTTLFVSFPVSMHKSILDTICFNLLPFTIDQQQRNTAKMLRQAKRNADKQSRKNQALKPASLINNQRPSHCIVRIEDSSEISGRDDNYTDLKHSHEAQEQISKFSQRSLDYPDDDIEDIDQDESIEDEDGYALMSVTSILVVAFHYIQEPAHHSQLIECLMKLKSNVFEDLLYVIAYGTTRARCPAVEILFRYWPDICPNQVDRKVNNQSVSKLKHIPWQPRKCQNKCCNFTTLDDDEAVKMCLDFKISITLSGLPPPMLVCLDCVDRICKQQFCGKSITDLSEQVTSGGIVPTGAELALSHPNEPTRLTGDLLSSATAAVAAPRRYSNGNCMQALDDHGGKFLDLLLPMDRISKLCENKKCRSTQDRTAIGTCFDIECASYNGKKPIRYCKTCFISIHEPCESNNYDVTLQNHIRHSSLNLNIMNSDEDINNFVEAIISLLREAAPAEKPSKDGERHLRSLMGPMSQFSSDNKDTNIATEEKQLISQYGIWLMTGLCKNVERLSDELLGRLLGMLFQWFHFTACLPDDQAGSALEKLKGECIKGWITEVKNKRLDVFISCLLPHPIDCSKIGGHWEVWPDNAHQIKEGFKRLLCLVPYDIITDDVWDEIMPHWMECFRHEVPENELSELKILLSKVFDPELSPLGFETKQMYNFISSRFEDPTYTNQEQTLYWMQIITMLEIPIPINFLYQMLRSGVKSLAQIRANELNRLKMVSRLNELNRRTKKSAKRKQKAQLVGYNSDEAEPGVTPRAHGVADQQHDANSLEGAVESGSDEGEEDEDEDGSQSRISVAEDDVLLPSSQAPGGDSKSVNDQIEAERQQTRQERQAQARAAFSAKIFQHATMLEAQQGIVGAHSTSALANVDATNPSALLGIGGSHQHQMPAKSQTTSQLAPMAANTPVERSLTPTNHVRPLNSTSGGKKEGVKLMLDDSDQTKTKKSAKPKLKLNLDTIDDYGTLSKIDNNLVCYILMMDILLKQLDLQEVTSHRGLDGKEAQQAIELLNAIISTPWLGKHTCCDSLSSTGSLSPTPGQVAGSSSPGSQNTFSASSMKQMMENSQARQNDKSTKSSTSADQAAQHPNIHSFGHCAQGFEHEDTYETCVFCEIISTFFQLSMSLVEYFSPVIEVSICEVSQDAANGEFDGKPDYSRVGLDHLGPSPKELNKEFNFSNAPPAHPKLVHQQDPTSPFSPSYSGPILKQEVLEALPKELQLSYNLLVQFHQYQTPDIVSQLLQMIKLISLHSQVLSKASKVNPQFISWCQHNMLVNKLWSLCQLESSEIARTCVPLLLHCITLPWGVRLFRDLVERDFNSDQWLSRFKAVERVVTIAYFCEPSTIKNSTLLQSTMTIAFCYVVRCLDDIEAIVAQRALISLEMMKTSSLKLLLWCLEVQFDNIIIDRPIILRSVFQLYNHLRDRRFLTWEFFLNRFDTIFLEAQIYLQQTGEIPSFTMQDLKNTNTKSEIYQRKIARARKALQETHHSRSIASRFQEGKFMEALNPASDKPEDSSDYYKQSLKLQRDIQPKPSPNLLSESRRGSPINSMPSPANLKGLVVAASPLRRVLQHGRSTSSRYQAVAYLTSQSLAKRKNSKFMSNLAMQSVPPLMSLPDKLHQHLPNSFVDDSTKLNEIAQENHVFGIVHRVCDEDRDTNHSLIFLLMQFFSKSDPSHPQTIKTLQRNHQIVLRHLNILMGYSVARKNYLISASNLRLLPVFNAFLTSLPKVIDLNYSLGSILLDTCLPVLIYCPATDNVQFDQIDRPKYSLWLLNPLMRQSWLTSVMTFLYKYQFNQPHLKDHVNMLIWIIINTLESHLNQTVAETAMLPTTPSVQNGGPSPNKSRSIDPAQLDDSLTSIDSPIKSQTSATNQTGMHKSHESIELQNVSTVSFEGSKTPGSGSESRQAKASRLLGNSRPVIVKADTSDNLATRSNLFKEFSSSGAGFGAAGSSLVQKGESHRQDQSVGATSRISSAQELNQGVDSPNQSSEERLLPIGAKLGPSGQQRAIGARPLTSSPAVSASSSNVERLLPIGDPPMITQVPVDAATSRIDMLTATTKSATISISDPLASASARPVTSVVGDSKKTSAGSPQTAVFGVSAIDSPKSSMSQQSQKSIIKEETQVDLVSNQTSVVSSKAARLTGGLFGAGKQSASDTKLFLNARQAETSLAPGGSELQNTGSGSSGKAGLGNFVVGGGKKNKFNKFQPAKDYVPKQPYQPGANNSQPGFSSPSILNEQLAQLNRYSYVQEFSDKDLSMCLVILETFIHHEPSMAAQMLPNILRLVARYSSSSFESWQSCSNSQLVGGSMFVARQFIRVALHDLMENNIFHQIFTSHFTGQEFYKSMSTALADFPDLNQLAPLSKLFEDLNKQKNLPQLTSLMTILENVATYFECITQEGSGPSHSQSTWNQFIMNWENFLRKLIFALPRYSANWTIDQTLSNVLSGSTGVSSANSNAPIKTTTGEVASGGGAGVGGGGQHGDVGGTNSSEAPVKSFNGSGGVAVSMDQVTGQKAGHHHHQQHGSQQHPRQQQNPTSCSMIMVPIMRIILSTTKVPHLATCKTIVDPYSKIISYTVCNSQFKYEHLLEINHNCYRLYTRDREKYLIQRQLAYELVQVLKFRFFILEENLLLLLLFVLQDVGGTLPTKVLDENLKIDKNVLNQADSYITNVSECLRQHMGDLLEFITDVHAISRINDNLIGPKPSSINLDSFGGHVKSAISQYLALEISLSNSGDQRTIARYLPWLYSSPSAQQGPREFIDCVSHIRQLSWLIMGSLQHSALVRDQHSGSSSSPNHGLNSNHQLLTGRNPQVVQCQPIPIEKNNNIAEHVQVILAGFAEQSKESVLHMSGLFHAFLLCQLWTMYCENICSQHPANSEQYQFCQSTLDDFWAKITPGVLRLVGHSRVMSEMVSTHFLQLIESLIESNSSVLIRYLPMWNSVFYSYKRKNKSSNLAIRLQKCIDWQPPDLSEPDVDQNRRRFINWLEKVQYKMSHIEIQSSQATPFYLS